MIDQHHGQKRGIKRNKKEQRRVNNEEGVKNKGTIG